MTSQALVPVIAATLTLTFCATARAKPPVDTFEVELVEFQGKTKSSSLRYLVPLDGKVSGPRCEIRTHPRDGQQYDLHLECRGLEVRTTRAFPLAEATLVAQVHDENGSGVTKVIVTRR